MSSKEYADKSLGKNVLTKIVLITVTGVLLLAGLRWVINTPVEAQSTGMSLYVEPGTIAIRGS